MVGVGWCHIISILSTGSTVCTIRPAANGIEHEAKAEDRGHASCLCQMWEICGSMGGDERAHHEEGGEMD